MTVNVYSPDGNASQIEGFTIVVDVLRAFSTAYYIDADNPRMPPGGRAAGKARLFGEEDYLFAGYFKERLLEGRPDFNSIVMRLRKGSGKGFLEPGFAPYTDFLHSLDVGELIL